MAAVPAGRRLRADARLVEPAEAARVQRHELGAGAARDGHQHLPVPVDVQRGRLPRLRAAARQQRDGRLQWLRLLGRRHRLRPREGRRPHRLRLQRQSRADLRLWRQRRRRQHPARPARGPIVLDVAARLDGRVKLPPRSGDGPRPGVPLPRRQGGAGAAAAPQVDAGAADAGGRRRRGGGACPRLRRRRRGRVGRDAVPALGLPAAHVHVPLDVGRVARAQLQRPAARRLLVPVRDAQGAARRAAAAAVRAARLHVPAAPVVALGAADAQDQDGGAQHLRVGQGHRRPARARRLPRAVRPAEFGSRAQPSTEFAEWAYPFALRRICPRSPVLLAPTLVVAQAGQQGAVPSAAGRPQE